MAAASTLTFTHLQSGQSVEVPVDATHSYIVASAVKQLNLLSENPPSECEDDTVPCMFYDPGFLNTVVCKSKVSLVDGKTGGLYYRGYDIDDLVAQSNFTEVAFLLIFGELPTKAQFGRWNEHILRHTYVHTELERQLQTFRYDSHPMGMLVAGIASLSTLHPEANPALAGESLYITGPREQFVHEYHLGSLHSDPPTLLQVRDHVRGKQVVRVLGKIPTIAAHVFRHREGRPYNHPMANPTSITQQFLYMVDRLNEDDYRPDPALVEILDKAFILLAESGSSCSTITMRHLVSSGVDPYSAISGACGALFGERKAGDVIRMLTSEIRSVDRIDEFLSQIKRKKSVSMPEPALKVSAGASKFMAANTASSPLKAAMPLRLQGFGHRIYKTEDPRVRLMKGLALRCFRHIHQADPEQPSRHPVYLALELEKRACADQYFTGRKLYPNIEYWTGVLLYTLGFPPDMFPVLLAIPRVVGYLAHAFESLDDKEYKIFRPRQIYLGTTLTDYKPEADRGSHGPHAERDLDAVSVQSNPAARLRRSLIEAVNLTDVNRLIEQTRASIRQLSEDVSTSLGDDRDPVAAEGSGSERITRRVLRRVLSMIQPKAGGAFGIAPTASATAAAAPAGQSAQQDDLSNLFTVSQRIEHSHGELRELLEVQRELLQLQRALRAQGTHLADDVDLTNFSKVNEK